MAERKQPNRRRCLEAGCNPLMFGQDAADEHQAVTGHRTAKWPVRSAEGRRKANARNRTGYYDKYNVGAKAADARGFVPGVRGAVDWNHRQAADEGWDDHKEAW